MWYMMQKTLMNEMARLMGTHTPYLERMDASVYMSRIRETLSNLTVKGKKVNISDEDMQELWENTMSVSKHGVMRSTNTQPDDEDGESSSGSESHAGSPGRHNKTKKKSRGIRAPHLRYVHITYPIFCN
jgi:hypothetical protein